MKYLNAKFILVFVAIIFILFPGVYSQNTPDNYQFIGQINDNMLAPVRITQGLNNLIYVTDYKQNCILVYDNTGSLIDHISLEFSPSSICIGENNCLYIGNKDTGKIFKREVDGTISVFCESTMFAADIETGPDGYIYIADSDLQQVLVLDETGNLIKLIGNGTLIYPSSISLDFDRKRIYVGEHGGLGTGFTPISKVWVFDLEGNILGSFGSYGNENGKFYRAQSISVGKCGYIYVCDSYLGCINVYNDDFQYVTTFGNFGNLPGEFNIPLDVFFDSNNRILVSSVNNGSVDIFHIDYDFPTAKIIYDNKFICPNENTDILIEFTGNPPWEFTYTVNGVNPTQSIAYTSPYYLNVSEPGIYQITELSDTQSASNCFTGFATIHKYEVPTGTISCEDQYICMNDTTLIQFNFSGTPPWTFSYTLCDSIPTDTETYENTFIMQVNKSGMYSLISLNDANCTGDIINNSVSVSVNSIPEAAMSSNDPSFCPGSSTSVLFESTGAQPWTYIYSINGIEQPLILTDENPYEFESSETGLYKLIYNADLNCSDNDPQSEINIEQFDLPTASLSSITEVICQGQSVNLPVNFTGIAPWDFTFTVNDDSISILNVPDNPYYITASEPGIYQLVTISDANCIGKETSGTDEVIEYPNPYADFSYSIDGLNVNFLNNSLNTGYSYWDFGDGSYGYEISPAHTYQSPGTYEVILISGNEFCGEDIAEKTIHISQVTIKNTGLKNIFKIYPNPTSGILNVDLKKRNNSNLILEISNSTGQIVYREKNISDNNQIHLQNLENGLYNIKIITDTDIYTSKFILEK